MHTMIRSHPLGEDTSALNHARRPSIVPTRRRIDRRFSSLGFTITTTQPWVEVLLATDPALFDPDRSASRTASNFYASRTHGGLTATTSGRARYVTPAGVVATLAATGSSLWFVAVGYPDSTGVGGITSSSTGASGAVVVDGSFRPSPATTTVRKTLSYGRGLTFEPGDRLDGEDGADVAPSLLSGMSAAPLARSTGEGMLDTEDRLDGEDGSDLPYAISPEPAASTPPPQLDPWPEPAAPAASAAPVVVPAATPDVAPATPSSNGTAPASGERLASLAYDDGWDSVDTASVPALSAIPALSDEYPDIDWGGTDYDDGYGAVPAYESLDEASAPLPAAPFSPPAAADGTVTTPQRTVVLPAIELPAEVQRQVIELTAADGGNAYSGVNADGPFRGRHGPGHKAYQRFHTGLSYGIAGFNQDSGTLGQLLRLMQEREPETFAAVFGAGATALVATATAPGPSSEHVEGGRGPRVQPVDGTDLWEEPWLSRFRAAGSVPDFRAAQNQLAAELYLAPMLSVAAGFGLTSERALCMVLDRAIALGEQGAQRWLADTVGPVKTPALRQSALAALGFDSIESFQASVPGLLTDGEFGPVSHATLTAALRLLGTASPLPLPGTGELVEEMARRGQSEDGGARLLRIATAAEFGDTPIGVDGG